MSIGAKSISQREVSQLYTKSKNDEKTTINKEKEAALKQTVKMQKGTTNLEISKAGRALQETISKEELNEMAENAKQESKKADDLIKIMEIARRISKGDHVPPKDEQRLMEYNFKMYLAAKSAATIAQNKHPKDWESVFEDEEDKKSDKMDSEYDEEIADILPKADTNTINEADLETFEE